MVPKLYPELWKLRLVVVLALSSLTTTFANAAFAQIVPDGTLGSDSSRLTNGNVRGLPAVLIEGGATRGVNLFQSFLQFNVGDGQRVYFSNPTGIENILTRVTGSDPSKIFGTLGVNGGANLFLLNPNGILFGPNARLDIAGSFLASTANSFVFENGLKFSATNPEAAPLITVNLRPGLQYGNQVATLSNSGNLTAGQDLTLTATNLDLQGTLQASRDLTLQATNTLKVRDSVANPFIAAAGGKLVVQGNQNVDIFALNHPDSGFFAGSDIVLRSANTVGGDAHYWAGGNFRIEQLNGELGNLFSPYDPIIRASGDVSFASYTGASLHILAGGSVTISGLVEITGADPTNGLTETITLSDGTQLNIDGQKNPTLDIRAGTTAFGTPGLTPPIRFPGENNKIDGNININAPSTSANIKIGSILNTRVNGRVFLTNQYQPNTNLSGGSIEITGGITNQDASSLGSYSVFAFGNPVTIDARSDVKIAQGIITGAGSGFTGGDINILSGGSVELNPGGVDVNSTIRGSLVSQSNGNSGNITVTAANNILATGDITSQVVQGDVGNGGNIILTSKLGEIDTRGVNITSKSSDGDANTNRGKAGNVTFTAAKDIRVGNIEASSNSNDKGFSTITVTSNDGSVFLNQSTLSTTNTGSNFAGDIRINALNEVKFEEKSEISSKGNFGRIFIGLEDLSPTTVTIKNSTLNTSNLVSFAPRTVIDQTAGDISIRASGKQVEGNFTAGSVTIIDNASITSSTFGNANAGNVSINIDGVDPVTNQRNGVVSLDKAFIFSNVESGGVGNGGEISINAGSLSLINGAQLQTILRGIDTENNLAGGQGDAGKVNINVSGQVKLQDNGSVIFSTVENGATGNSGEINIQAGSLSLTNGAELQTLMRSLNGNGNAGSIDITTTGSVAMDNSRIFSTVEAGTGNAGLIKITASAGSISLTNGSQIKTDNNGSGLAGNIEIIANNQDLSIEDSQITSESNNETTAGFPFIRLAATNGSVFLNQSRLSTTNTGSGYAGDIRISALNEVSILDSFSSGEISTDQKLGIFSKGNFGRIFIGKSAGYTADLSPKTVTIANSQLNTDNNNIAKSAGDISIDAIDKVSINNGSDISSITNTTGTAGRVTIQSIQGSVDINGGSRITVETTAEGSGGELNINSASLNLTNSQLQAQTRASGAAGNVSINKDDSTKNGLVTIDNSQIFSTIEPGGTGNGGKIDITARSLFLQNGAQLQTLVRQGGNGIAGNIKLTVTDTIKLDGTRTLISSELQPGTTGQGGSIDIDPNLVELTNGAKITVDSQGNGPAGDIILNSNLLTLNNQSAITSRANSGDGGNVTFNIRDLLLLQGNSQISTSSGVNGAGGNGGFITINAPNGFIVAPPLLGNSDITANAFLGSGGVVDITAKGVFGLRLLTRQQLQQELGTSISTQLDPQNLPTNDITAISQTDPKLDGNVNINSPDVDPSKSIVSLPENPSDPSKKITQGCRVGEFLNTGRGGLPTRPDDSLTSEAVWEDLRQTATRAQQPKSSERATTPTQENVVSIIPATGWIFNGKGEVTLISHTHQANSSPSWSNSSSCPVR